MFSTVFEKFINVRQPHAQQVIAENLKRLASLDHFDANQMKLFKQFQVLLQAKAYEEASQVLAVLVSTS